MKDEHCVARFAGFQSEALDGIFFATLRIRREDFICVLLYAYMLPVKRVFLYKERA